MLLYNVFRYYKRTKFRRIPILTIKEIVASIKAKQPEIKTVYFVGCGASQSDLFPAKYFLENNAKKLRTSIYTANNFNYSTPAGVDDTAIVITCSLSGNTPETVAWCKDGKACKSSGTGLRDFK